MDSDSILSRLLSNCDRRTFIKACGAAGVGLVTGGVAQGVFDVIRLDGGQSKVSLTRLAMGTFVTVTAVHESRTLAEEAVGRAFEEMERLVAIFTRYDPSSPVSILNRDGALDGPPPELSELVRRAVRFSSLTRGAFDITVKPLVDLVRRTAQESPGTLPDTNDIESALDLVGADNLDVAPRRLRLLRAGMGVTLDGIAKGHIADRMSEVLSSYSVDNHLIDAGGDILARGADRDRRSWKIAIQDPGKRGNYLDVIEVTRGAIATSGSYEIYYDKEKVLHHIVDPSTGLCPRHTASASVRARSVTEADALSTALFVTGKPNGIALVDALEGVGCLVIGGDSSQHCSRGWRSDA